MRHSATVAKPSPPSGACRGSTSAGRTTRNPVTSTTAYRRPAESTDTGRAPACGNASPCASYSSGSAAVAAFAPLSTAATG
ncbi:hypothetical protein ACIRPG_08515 [Streptomyces sp. NPDC101754]|uniref:hypothetical protein n=1 Tax=Streptomyces sp. NPDC101754 TaxID=3366145 RepID=UPI0038274954